MKSKWQCLLFMYISCAFVPLYGQFEVENYILYETPMQYPTTTVQQLPQSMGQALPYKNPYTDVTVDTSYMNEDPRLVDKIAEENPHDGQQPAPQEEECQDDERAINEHDYEHSHHKHGKGGYYRLKIGDQLYISIYGEPFKPQKPITVDPDGNISFLFINSLKVEGKTISQVKITLENRLKEYYRNPLVIVTLSLSLGDHFTILGEVRAPGKKRILGDTTVLTALSQAGGFNFRDFRNQTIDTADLNKSFLSRNGEYIPVDFNALINGPDLSQDMPLKPGDYIFIAANTIDRVFVLGEVGTPSTVDFFQTITLAEAIAQAGGLNYVASSRVAVIRGALCYPTYYLVDINRILKGYACDFWLEPGDIVYVPPMRFTTIKEISKAAIINFVGAVANIAGTRAFISVTPAAAGNTIGPVPTVNFGTTAATTATGGVVNTSVNAASTTAGGAAR